MQSPSQKINADSRLTGTWTSSEDTNCSPEMPQCCLHTQQVSLRICLPSEQQLAEGNRVSGRGASAEVNAHRHSPAFVISLMVIVTVIFVTSLKSDSRSHPVRQRRASFTLYVTQLNSSTAFWHRPTACIHYTHLPPRYREKSWTQAPQRQRNNCVFERSSVLQGSFKSPQASPHHHHLQFVTPMLQYKQQDLCVLQDSSLVRKSVWSLTFFCVQAQDVYHHFTKYGSDAANSQATIAACNCEWGCKGLPAESFKRRWENES